MNYLYEALDKPTRLYIKQCPHCGIKYFGKTIVEDIEKYHGSGIYWSRHLEKHGVEPTHLWNSDWYYNTSITRFALKFSKINKISQSQNWANLIDENGINGGDSSHLIDYAKCVINRRKTISDKNWQDTVLIEQKKKEKATKTDPTWIKTVGIKRNKKQSESVSKTMNNPTWIETVGKNAREKISSSVKNTINDDEWKQKHYKQCEHCGKGPMPKRNYNTWHGENCKNKK